MNTLILFNQALKDYSINELANSMMLHTGTLKRWQQQGKVPNSYRQHLLRILNMENIDENLHFSDKDQFFTKQVVAQDCLKQFNSVVNSLKIDTSNYIFIEPSAGHGCFYNLLPNNRKIGIDIEPRIKGIIKSDYLKWKPKNTKNANTTAKNKDPKYIVIGNPPFGLRGNMALHFINHSYNFADLVAFILPQLFASDGKGSTKGRVLGYKLAHSSRLPRNSFQYPDGKEVDINTIFQVWSKVNTAKISTPPIRTCDEYITVYSLSDGGTPSSTRNKKMLNECDIYLPSTTFQKMQTFDNFEDLPHRRGYGVVIHQMKQQIMRIMKSHDWRQTAFFSTNSALNLRSSLIKEVVIKHGFEDKDNLL